MLDVGVVQLVHCAQDVAGQHVDIDDVVAAEHPVVGVAEHPEHVVAAEHPVVGVAEHPEHVVAAEHPVVGVAEHPEHVVAAEHPVVGVVAAEHPVVGVVVVIVVELDDICATAPTAPKIENATAATTRTAAIFLTAVFPVAVPPFFLGGASISGETSITNGIFSISAPPFFLGGF